MSSIISLLPFDLYKLYSIAVEVYYALRAFALLLGLGKGWQNETVKRKFDVIRARVVNKYPHPLVVWSASGVSFGADHFFAFD